jgi:hypothetical protein
MEYNRQNFRRKIKGEYEKLSEEITGSEWK